MAFLYQTPERQPYPVQETTIDSADVATKSMIEEAIKTNQQAEQEKAASEFTRMASEAARNPEVLNALQRRMANNIVAQKMNYRDALANGDAEAMDYANKLAEAQRLQGNAIGWNGDGYGSDVSLEQAAQNLANNDARALNQIFYDSQRPADYYQARYRMYRDNGASMGSAERLAQQDTERYHDNQIYKLLDTFQTYGKDPRGVINDNGVRMMAMLGDLGGSEMANYITNMYAKPINEYDYQNQIAKMGITQRDLLERMAKQNDYATQARQENFANAEKMAILNSSLGLNREIQLMQARVMAGVMQREEAHQWLVNKYMAAGLDEQSANIAALTSLNGKGGKGATSGFNKDLAKELRETANSLYEQADAAELNGDKERAAQLRAQADQYMAQHTAMLSGGKANSNDAGVDVNDYNSLRKAFQQLINDNASRPWDKQRDRADLVRIFLSNVGEDNPMAQKIVSEAEWGGNTGSEPAKPAESKQGPQASSSKPQQTKTSSSSGTYTGQQIVVPEGAAQAVRDAATMIPVYGPDGKFKRSIYPYQITPEMAINEGPNGRYVVE